MAASDNLDRRDDDVEVAKEGESADPSLPQPTAAEVESARLLANEARGTLRARGMNDTDIDRLAGAFIARGLGTAAEDFIAWVASTGPGS